MNAVFSLLPNDYIVSRIFIMLTPTKTLIKAIIHGCLGSILVKIMDANGPKRKTKPLVRFTTSYRRFL
jgi:hypothetical protein